MRRPVRLLLGVWLGVLMMFPSTVLAQAESAHQPMVAHEWGLLIMALIALPIVAIMVTSFVKISIVLAILRSAIGARGVPPGYVIFGLALILTVFVMAPVGSRMYEEASEALSPENIDPDAGEMDRVTSAMTAGIEPLRQFLDRHCHDSDRDLFLEIDAQRNGVTVDQIRADGLLVLMPAFVLSELKEAFLIGFLIFLPFLVIDLVISNILVSLGLTALRPAAVSLPFKLLLFVLVDGWLLLIKGLVESYLVV